MSSKYPTYVTKGHTNWTAGFRACAFYFRSGLAWLLLGWAVQVMPLMDPAMPIIVVALLAAAKADKE